MGLLDDKTLASVAPVGGFMSAPCPSDAGSPAASFDLLSTTPGRLSDQTLMAFVAQGDSDAFALLYGRHARAAVSLATQMCHRRAIAEEIVQDAFLSVWRSRRHFDSSRGSPRAWVLGIVRNRAIDVLRQNTAYALAEDDDRRVEDLIEASECTDGEVGRREGARELLVALNALPPEQSCVITLAYYGGYSHTEIASMLKTPIGTVKGRMRLGLRKMARSFSAPRNS